MDAVAKRAVTVIPARVNLPQNAMTTAALKRVAAYARVSTDDEEQRTSYEAQVAFYENHIKSNPAWSYVEVYTDV
jgi:predicted site-specific integrase-resolvase